MRRPKEIPICDYCGGVEVACDANAKWNPDRHEWDLHQVFDQMFCEECERDTEVTWKELTAENCDA
jgi:hypothetical protein